MHDLGSGHRLRQVRLKHVAPIQPRRGLQGSFLHDHAERTPLRLRLEPCINFQACQLGLGLPKGDCDVRPGMVVQILGFLGDPPLHTPVLVPPPRRHFLGPQRIAPEDRAAARVGHFLHLRSKQGQVEHLVFDQPGYLRFGYSRNIREARPGQGLHLAALDHAPVTHERHPLTPKPPGDLRNLGRHRGHIGGIPCKDLSRYRGALLVTQEPNDHLFLADFAISVIAKSGQGVALPLEVTARDVVQK